MIVPITPQTGRDEAFGARLLSAPDIPSFEARPRESSAMSKGKPKRKRNATYIRTKAAPPF